MLELLSKPGAADDEHGPSEFFRPAGAGFGSHSALALPVDSRRSLRRFGARDLATALLQAAVAVTVIVVFGRVLLRPLFRLVATTGSTELFMAAVLFVIVGAGVIAEEAGTFDGAGRLSRRLGAGGN